MDSLTPLARISRYGDVRQTDAAQVLHVVDGIVVRVCVGLSAACQSLDDEASAAMANRIAAVNGAIKILEKPEHLAAWRTSLGYLADGSGIHERLRGLSSRILLDDKQASPEDSSARMSRALSRGAAPEGAAAWLEGFLSGGGMVLVHDDTLLGLIDEWVCHLSPDHFTQTLPLVRRSFSTFPAMERRQFGQRIQKAKPGSAASPRTHTSADWDLARAEKVLPVLREIFGIEKR
jgi:hypothetical protein